MAFITFLESGDVGDENHSTSRPSGAKRYLWKFQRGLAIPPSSLKAQA